MDDPDIKFAKELAEQSRNACWELAKYLFTANSGAAAGLLFLLRSTPGNMWLIISFYSFCVGTFFVLTSYFVGASLFVEISEEFQKALQAQTDKKQIAVQHNERLHGWKSKWIVCGGRLSFTCLMFGGVLAAIPFYKGAIPMTEQRANTTVNVVVTNTPTFSLSVTSALPVYFSAPVTNAMDATTKR